MPNIFQKLKKSLASTPSSSSNDNAAAATTSTGSREHSTRRPSSSSIANSSSSLAKNQPNVSSFKPTSSFKSSNANQQQLPTPITTTTITTTSANTTSSSVPASTKNNASKSSAVSNQQSSPNSKTSNNSNAISSESQNTENQPAPNNRRRKNSSSDASHFVSNNKIAPPPPASSASIHATPATQSLSSASPAPESGLIQITNNKTLNLLNLILNNNEKETAMFEPKIKVTVIFDPEPAPDDPPPPILKRDSAVLMDDRSFMGDDDQEVAEITNGSERLAVGNNCYVINEVPEGRLSSSRNSRLNSRANSVTKPSDSDSDIIANNGTNNNNNKSNNDVNILNQTSNSDAVSNGSKNLLLDALIRKFNVNMELNDDIEENENPSNNGQALTGSNENATRANFGTTSSKHSELHKKIVRNQLKKSLISDDSINVCDATSSFDDYPKRIKYIRSTGTQVSVVGSGSSGVGATVYSSKPPLATDSASIASSSSSTSSPRNHQQQKLQKQPSTQRPRTAVGALPSASTQKDAAPASSSSSPLCRLPQSFECKYIGKTRCSGLWGVKYTREPVDRLVGMAKRLPSIDDLPNLEALVSDKGIFLVQKPPTTSTTSAHKQSVIKSKANGKAYKSGLLPISHISYAAQDTVYSKVFSCIVIREGTTGGAGGGKGDTVGVGSSAAAVYSECYSFLCARNEVAKRMAVAITSAFKEYGKLLQTKETNISRMMRLRGLDGSVIGDPDSYA